MKRTRNIYNEDGMRVRMPLELEAEWNEFMLRIRQWRERKGQANV